MLASVGAIALQGLEPRPVRVECTTGPGLPVTRVVGLPDAAVREAGDRVKSAVQRAGATWPQSRVVVNLAPAALPKVGAGFDLPVALSVLGASGQVPASALEGLYAVGEVGLDGQVRPVPGTLPVAMAVRALDARRLLVPEGAAVEASLAHGFEASVADGEASAADGLEVVPVAHLREAIEILRGQRRPRPVGEPPAPPPAAVPDLLDVRGQPVARRALELAAAGGHHLLLAGPPGCGKSMLAHRLSGLLPDLTVAEALEVAAIHSVAGVRAPDAPLARQPPFRDPHHTTSAAGLIGGGAGIPRPGEISLAHRGVLFVDELLEVPRWVLDALRQPLETGTVSIVRARHAVRYPAQVLLVGATNPCPCGYLGTPGRACRCRPDQVARYRSRLSGPLLDRFDLQVELRPVDHQWLVGAPDGEGTATVAGRVRAARAMAVQRWGAGAVVARATVAQLRDACGPAAMRTLARAVESLGLSARAFDRTLRVARTIADLAGDADVERDHVDEAIAYRLAPAVPV